MVQDNECWRKCKKHAHDSGEPAAKKYCVQLGEKPSKFSIPFNGSNEEKDKPKAVKRNAPQDNLSAQVYPRYLKIF